MNLVNRFTAAVVIIISVFGAPNIASAAELAEFWTFQVNDPIPNQDILQMTPIRIEIEFIPGMAITQGTPPGCWLYSKLYRVWDNAYSGGTANQYVTFDANGDAEILTYTIQAPPYYPPLLNLNTFILRTDISEPMQADYDYCSFSFDVIQ